MKYFDNPLAFSPNDKPFNEINVVIQAPICKVGTTTGTNNLFFVWDSVDLCGV
jgi:hypothetical protein